MNENNIKRNEEYLRYVEKLLPKNPIDIVDLDGDLKLTFYNLKQTFDDDDDLGLPKLDNEDIISVSVSKTGGHVLYMLYNKQTEGSNITIEQAKQKASDFLTKKEYENMYSTYYMNENNIATINFAYHQGDITIYPDLIKVQVAMYKGIAANIINPKTKPANPCSSACAKRCH